jgi:peptidoglycan hydrolase CwlO-like protein
VTLRAARARSAHARSTTAVTRTLPTKIVTLRTVTPRTVVVTALIALAVLLAVLPPNPVHAEPAAGPEGGSKALRDQLDAAARGFNDAVGRLDASKSREAQLAGQMRATDTQLAQLSDQVNALAVTAYKGARVGGLVALLESGSPDNLVQRAATLESKARADDEKLRQLKAVKTAQRTQQAALADEVESQRAQLAEMDKRKKDAEKALAEAEKAQAEAAKKAQADAAKKAQADAAKAQADAAKAQADAARAQAAANSAPAPATAPRQPAASPNPIGTGGAAVPAPAPRRPDGSLAPESCNQDDPTTSGCLTPRTLHALKQTQAAGFNRFVSCYRSQEDGGEHPRGRACDFAAQTSGFGGVATGGDRDYGNRLAAWYVANAQRLGVLYVIWFKQIWLPSTGWRAYTNGNGDPSSDHTNHVHLSVQ